MKENGKATLTTGFHKIVVFFSFSHSCCINVTTLYLCVTVTLLTSRFYLCKALVSNERYLVYLQKYLQGNKLTQVILRL